MKKLLYTILFVLLAMSPIFAAKLHPTVATAEGYEIKLKFSDYRKDTLFLGYQMTDKQFIRDTAFFDKKTELYVFKGKRKLEPGMYLIIPDTKDNFFQIMMSEDDQFLQLTTTMADPYKDGKVKNGKDNALFFGYMAFIGEKRKVAETANEMMANDSTKKAEARKMLEGLDKEVKGYQLDLIKKNPKTSTAALLKAAMEIDIPDNPADKENDLRKYFYMKAHCFDNFEMTNLALLRTPILFQRVDYFVSKLTPPAPDSICESIDRVLELFKPTRESFNVYFAHFFNAYANSKIVGYDAIFVHLVKKYIETGATDSLFSKESKDKNIATANKLAPILIGKLAPPVKMFMEDGKTKDLYDVKSKYTVLYIWDPDCGHCQKSMPKLAEFYQKFSTKGVQVYAVCNKKPTDVSKCWEYIKDKKIGDWINVIDPYQISRYSTLYNVETTPVVFVLDENKRIISKNIDAAQLEEVIGNIMKDDEKKREDEKKKDADK